MILNLLISVITTAGFDLKSPCYKLYEYCCNLLKGVFENDSQFVYIAQMDEHDDRYVPENWIKANPILEFDRDALENLIPIAHTARDMGGEDLRDFLVKQLNMWMQWSNADKLYYPMFGGSYDGTRIRSLAGQTLMYNTNASTEITRAKANGNGWNIGSWSKRNLLDCMLKIMSKTDNSQTAFGQGQTSGYVNDASQNYGHLATGTLTNKGQFFGYKDTTHEVKVFYIEKWWGNRWDRINGLLMVGGEILAKMTPPYNLTGKDFEKVGITFASSGSGWQKGTKSSRFGRIVNSTGGSSSTYTCDYLWWNAGITAVALVGGYCDNGDYCGVDCLNLYSSAGNAYWNFGASVFLEQPIAA